LSAIPPRLSSANASNGGRLFYWLAAACHLQRSVSISSDCHGRAGLSRVVSTVPSSREEQDSSGRFVSTCALVRADIPASSTGFRGDMPDDRCVLLLCNAQVLSLFDLGWFNPKSSCRNHRDLGERNTDPRGFPPSHAAIAHASLVKHKIE
jgi:hypothetical protein